MKKTVRKYRVLTALVKAGVIAGSISAPSFSAYGGDVVGKVVVGYQGWLSAPNDGSAVSKWKHTNMECWPDVREYTTTYSGCTFYQAGSLQSAFNGNLGNGQPAKMVSNWNDQTVNKHFEWMQQYEIDCAAVQRFGSELKDSAMKAYRDGIASKVRTAAQTYGRKYYIMYDISGWTAFQSEIKTDWTNSMKAHTNSSAYAKENGKPVVCIWGIGFSDRPGDVTSWTDVVNWFKGQGCYVIGGVSGKFDTDTVNKNAYKACNMLMSWRVGSTLNPFTVFGEELVWCKNNGIAYQGDIYAGISFYNTDPSRPKNRIPRQHGDFMWTQFAAAKNKGIHGIYISMFDEVQEATQIFKVAENSSQIPAGKYFLTLDVDGVACSSDFYLRLTQDGGKMFKGQIAYTTTHPTAHMISTPPSGLTATASHKTDLAPLGVDKNGTTRWHSGASQIPGMWYKLDQGSAKTVGTVVLDAGVSVSDYPRGYIAEVSTDNSTWTQVASATSEQVTASQVNGDVTISFVPVSARYIRIKTINTYSKYWSIYEATVSSTGTVTQTTKTFTSVAAEDGYLNESTETSNIGGGFNTTGTAGAGLRIGDTTTKQQIKSTVSFDTSSLPDGAVITSATLKLKRGAIAGTPTSLGAIRVDIKGGTGFNNVSSLTKEDFQAAADATNVATMSYPTANGTLSTGNLSSTGLTKINKTGKTQLRVYFATDDDNDATSDYLGFYPAENSTVANRPVLVITYQ